MMMIEVVALCSPKRCEIFRILVPKRWSLYPVLKKTTRNSRHKVFLVFSQQHDCAKLLQIESETMRNILVQVLGFG